MALTRDQKQAQVKELTQKLSDCNSVIFAHYIGLSVAEVGQLRSQLKEQEAEMKVAKKTLAKLAAKEAGFPELTDEALEGPVSFIFSFGDPLSGAQVAFKFAKDHDQVQLIGGVFDGKVLTKEEAVELAKMPSREVLLATFIGMIRSPMTSFAGMCNSPLSGFARALSELAEKGGVNPEAEAAEKEAEESKEADDSEEKPAAEETKAEEAKDEKAVEESNDAKETEEAAAKEETKADDAEEQAEEPETKADEASPESSDSSDPSESSDDASDDAESEPEPEADPKS